MGRTSHQVMNVNSVSWTRAYQKKMIDGPLNTSQSSQGSSTMPIWAIIAIIVGTILIFIYGCWWHCRRSKEKKEKDDMKIGLPMMGSPRSTSDSPYQGDRQVSHSTRSSQSLYEPLYEVSQNSDRYTPQSVQPRADEHLYYPELR